MTAPANDTRPLQVADLDTCAACGKAATSWADGPNRQAVGVCSFACRRAIELAVARVNGRAAEGRS